MAGAIARWACLIVGLIMIYLGATATPVNGGLIFVGIVLAAIGGVFIIIFGDLGAIFGGDD